MDVDTISVVYLDETGRWWVTWGFKIIPEGTLLRLYHGIEDLNNFRLEDLDIVPYVETKVPKKWKIYSLKFDDESTKERNRAAEKFFSEPTKFYGPVLITQLDASDNVQDITSQAVESLKDTVLKREKFCSEDSLALLGDGAD